jgi:glycerol-3-phosphate dehydrogenase (NAD(P)+)
MNTHVSVIGGGSWGTALAMVMAEKGHSVSLWVYEADLAETINRNRENAVFLPGIRIPDTIRATSSLDQAVSNAGLVLFVVPSHAARGVLQKLGPSLPSSVPMVVATKGIENETLKLMLEVARDVLPSSHHSQLAVLSGPSFAREACTRHPTAVVVASEDLALCNRIQEISQTPTFKLFTSTDTTGVQLGGALKNVIALAAGGADGLGFGHNTRAALIARGLAEIIRLGKAMGADPKTFSGLSGLGDLILTCTGELSRNRTVGFQIGKGRQVDDILRDMKMVAEGVHTARAAWQLSRKHAVRMPIVEQVYEVLFKEKDARQAVTDLMENAGGDETDW